MKFRVSNVLFKDDEGRGFEIQAVFDDFEGVITKIVKDLNSLWKGVVPLPMSIKIEEHKESWSGVRLLHQGNIMGENADIASSDDLFQVWGTEMQKLIAGGFFEAESARKREQILRDVSAFKEIAKRVTGEKQ
jgi:hypothetical protein